MSVGHGGFAGKPGYSLVLGDSGTFRWHKDASSNEAVVEQFRKQWSHSPLEVVHGDVQGEHYVRCTEGKIDAESGYVDITGPVSSPKVNLSVVSGGETVLEDVFASSSISAVNSTITDVSASEIETTDATVSSVTGNGRVVAHRGSVSCVEVYKNTEAPNHGLVAVRGGRIRNCQVSGQLHANHTELGKGEARDVTQSGLGLVAVNGGKLTDSVVDVPAGSALIMHNSSVSGLKLSLPEGVIAGVGVPEKYLNRGVLDHPGPAMVTPGRESNTVGIITCPNILTPEFVYHEAKINQDGDFEVTSTPFGWFAVSRRATIGDKLFDQPVADHVNSVFNDISPINDHGVQFMNKLIDKGRRRDGSKSPEGGEFWEY